MYKILFILFLGFLPFLLLAQNSYSIKGTVVDTVTNPNLINSAVSVLNANDSTLVNFTWASSGGTFSINGLPPGKLILLVTYHGYADYVEHFTLDSSLRLRNFGQIKLFQKAILLEEVLIKGTTAIKIKGDTTQFNASSYKIQPNDRVEDLLRQLPGIQVDQNGKITAQGQPVNKVLVDGEEFFGDDPTLVTRNIRADMVDKVQLYDKKSDQAAFTGINDGKKEKAINITLKADKKNGYFGKVDAGVSTDEYYQGQGMYNAFRTKQKLSIFGTLGNTNRTGLSVQDSRKYGTSLAGAGDMLESFSGRYSGEGLPNALTGGGHYDAKWNSDKESINLNYKIGSIDVTGVKNTVSQNILPSGSLLSNFDQNNDNTFFRQKADAVYQLALTPSSTLKVTADAILSTSQTKIEYLAITRKDNNELLNSQNRSIDNTEDQKSLNIAALLTKKFKKQGRTASLSINQLFNKGETDGFLYSSSDYYTNSSILDSTRLVNQYKPTTSENRHLGSNITYSHPFTKPFSVVLNYGLNINKSNLDIKSFNPSSPGQYNLFDDLFSSNFNRKLTTNNAGAIFSYAKKKTIVTFGTRLAGVEDNLTDLDINKEYKRDYININPQGSFQYAFTQQKSLSINYSRSTVQPSLNQLQPIRVNTDPLNITVGNSLLNPAFNNTFSMVYNSYGLKGQGLLFDSYYIFSENPIISNTITDAAGKNTYQAVNLDNKNTSSYYFSIATSSKLEKSQVQINIDLYTSGGLTYNISNNVLNRIKIQEYSGTIAISKLVVKKYDFRFLLNPSYNFNQSSLQTKFANSGWVTKSTASFNIYLPRKIQFGSSLNYLFQGKTQTFSQDFERLLLNASLTKKFLKNESLSLALSGNDLLNQNKGFTRNTSGTNMFTQSEYTTIRRYTMLSLIWDFTKISTSTKK